MQQLRFRVCDKILIIKKKRNFEKVYTPRWPEDIFEVSQIIITKPPKYRLKDFSGEEIQCPTELQKKSQDIFRIEKVLRGRTRDSIR